METRRIQRSGTTFYIYLPTAWCRKNKITTDSIVSLSRSAKDDLIIHNGSVDEQSCSLNLSLEDNTAEVINKLIMALYVNPVKSFDISVEQKIEEDQILMHKKLLGGLDLIDFDEKKISSQTALSVGDADMILRTMIKKLINIIKLMKKGKAPELIGRYEEEIDKSNIMIYKTVVSCYMHKKDSKLKHIELFYISLISRTIEQMTDSLLNIKKDKVFLDELQAIIEKIEDILFNLDQNSLISYTKDVVAIKEKHLDDNFYKRRILSKLNGINEVMADWYISKKAQ